MPQFSAFSKNNLETCHPKLQVLFEEVIKHFDCRVTDGYRDEATQNAAYKRGFSTKRFPDSKHNKYPSRAIDVTPYPVDYMDTERQYFFGGFVKGVAAMLEIPIRWGGDWDRDTDVHDQHFMDLPHFEVLGE